MKKDYLEKIGWFFAPRFWWLRHLLFWFYRYSDTALGKLGVLSDVDVSLRDFLFLHLLPFAGLACWTASRVDGQG